MRQKNCSIRMISTHTNRLYAYRERRQFYLNSKQIFRLPGLAVFEDFFFLHPLLNTILFFIFSQIKKSNDEIVTVNTNSLSVS